MPASSVAPTAQPVVTRTATHRSYLMCRPEHFPDSILVSEAEAEAEILALNSVSDGHNVVVAPEAVDYIRQLRENGYNPVPVDLSELLKGGGGIKCCTQELRRSVG